jgi:O-antigen ligase
VLLLAGLFALQSRLGLLLLAVVAVPEIARNAGPRARAALMLATLVVLALALSWLFDKGLAGVTARLQLWHSAWQLFLEQPWLGVGPHGFVLAYPELLTRADLADPRLTPWPHSLPLELLAEGGIVVALAAGLLLFSARNAMAAWGRSPVVASFLLLSLVEASTLRLWLWVLLVLFLLLSGARNSLHRR